jgi:hypothetical protein
VCTDNKKKYSEKTVEQTVVCHFSTAAGRLESHTYANKYDHRETESNSKRRAGSNDEHIGANYESDWRYSTVAQDRKKSERERTRIDGITNSMEEKGKGMQRN